MAAPMTEAAIQRIRDLIRSGELAPGARLPAEAELAAELGMSRNTAREAVRALITARVLDVRRGDGTYVTSLRPELLLEGVGYAVDLLQDDSLLELVEVRLLLEPMATSLAATRAGPDDLAALRESMAEMDRVKDQPEQLILADAEFHARVARATGNETLVSLLTAVSSRTLRARMWRGVRVSGSSERTLSEHRRILEAIEAADADLARAAARVHVASTQRWIEENLAERDAAAAGSAG